MGDAHPPKLGGVSRVETKRVDVYDRKLRRQGNGPGNDSVSGVGTGERLSAVSRLHVKKMILLHCTSTEPNVQLIRIYTFHMDPLTRVD